MLHFFCCLTFSQNHCHVHPCRAVTSASVHTITEASAAQPKKRKPAAKKAAPSAAPPPANPNFDRVDIAVDVPELTVGGIVKCAPCASVHVPIL